MCKISCKIYGIFITALLVRECLSECALTRSRARVRRQRRHYNVQCLRFALPPPTFPMVTTATVLHGETQPQQKNKQLSMLRTRLRLSNPFCDVYTEMSILAHTTHNALSLATNNERHALRARRPLDCSGDMHRIVQSFARADKINENFCDCVACVAARQTHSSRSRSRHETRRSHLAAAACRHKTASVCSHTHTLTNRVIT